MRTENATVPKGVEFKIKIYLLFSPINYTILLVIEPVLKNYTLLTARKVCPLLFISEMGGLIYLN